MTNQMKECLVNRESQTLKARQSVLPIVLTEPMALNNPIDMSIKLV